MLDPWSAYFFSPRSLSPWRRLVPHPHAEGATRRPQILRSIFFLTCWKMFFDFRKKSDFKYICSWLIIFERQNAHPPRTNRWLLRRRQRVHHQGNVLWSGLVQFWSPKYFPPWFSPAVARIMFFKEFCQIAPHSIFLQSQMNNLMLKFWLELLTIVYQENSGGDERWAREKSPSEHKNINNHRSFVKLNIIIASVTWCFLRFFFWPCVHHFFRNAFTKSTDSNIKKPPQKPRFAAHIYLGNTKFSLA